MEIAPRHKFSTVSVLEDVLDKKKVTLKRSFKNSSRSLNIEIVPSPKQKFSKVLSTMTKHGKCTRALTSENL